MSASSSFRQQRPTPPSSSSFSTVSAAGFFDNDLVHPQCFHSGPIDVTRGDYKSPCCKAQESRFQHKDPTQARPESFSIFGEKGPAGWPSHRLQYGRTL